MNNQDNYFFECLKILVEYAKKEYMENDNNILHINSQDYVDLENFTNELQYNFNLLKDSLANNYLN